MILEYHNIRGTKETRIPINHIHIQYLPIWKIIFQTLILLPSLLDRCHKLASSQVSNTESKIVCSQVYSKVSFLFKQIIMIIILVLKHRYPFSIKNRLFYIQYHTFCRIIHNVSCSMYVPSLENVVTACLIFQIIFLYVTSRYINTLLTYNIQSRAIYNLQLFQLNDGIILLRIL